MKVAQLLGLWGPWRHQVCRDTECLRHRSYGPIRVFFQGSCSQSFSVALSIQALSGLPCLGSFSVVQGVSHIQGPHWVESYSVVQCVRHLMGQSLCCSADDADVWGERGCGDGSNPTCDSAVSPCFHGFPAFLHRHFPPQSLPHIPLIHLSTVNSSPRPGIAPASSRCAFQGTCTLSGVCMAAARTV